MSAATADAAALLEPLLGMGPKNVITYAKKLTDAGWDAKSRKSLLSYADILPIATVYDLRYAPQRIPRTFIDRIKLPFKHFFGGSYSRGQPNSGDIDLMVPNTVKIEEIAEELRPYGELILPPYYSGDTICATMLLFSTTDTKSRAPLIIDGVEIDPDGRGHHPAKIDIYFIPEDEWVPAKLYLTGSGKFNILMRAAAKKHGYLLNQHGLYKCDTNKLISTPREEDIFATIGKKWVPPIDRNL